MIKLSATVISSTLVAILLGSPSVSAGDSCARAPSLEGLQVAVAIDPANGEFPESVTEDRNGNLYFSISNTIRKRTPSGELSTFATLPLPIFALGVKVGPDGCIYNVSTSLSAVAGAFVWRTCAAGVTEQFAALDQQGGPNDLAFDEEGNLFVTDPFLGQVWKIDRRGRASVWLADPLLQGDPGHPALVFHTQGVNGIAFDEGGKELYLGNLDFGRILRVSAERDRRGDRCRSALSIFAEDQRLVGADGIAFDENGNLFVAVNAQDRVAVVDPRGRTTVLAEGGVLDGVSSIVFGTTARDRRTAHLVSSAFSRGFGFQPGTPRPALLQGEVAAPGLPLLESGRD